MHQPWPYFLDYENDDDFYDWYTGEVMPSPEEIIWKEIEIVEIRHPVNLEESLERYYEIDEDAERELEEKFYKEMVKHGPQRIS
jgi:hypothetical protein